jgi:hypothetical protein
MVSEFAVSAMVILLQLYLVGCFRNSLFMMVSVGLWNAKILVHSLGLHNVTFELILKIRLMQSILTLCEGDVFGLYSLFFPDRAKYQ